MTPTLHPIGALSAFAGDLRRDALAGNPPDTFDALAVDTLAGEARRHEAGTEALAHRAECADAEGLRTLDAVLADGTVSRSELSALRRARRLIRRSLRLDHLIGERARV